MRLAGWRIEGAFPDVPRALMVVAPHTSNWDFPIGVAAMFALGLRVSWLGKHTLFRWPLGPLMRWLGGVPVRRDARSGTVAQAVAEFARRRQFFLALAPEGTRSAVREWRLGFAHIAAGAGVPVLPVVLDWGRRRLGLGPLLTLSGDVEADLVATRACFAEASGKHPELAGADQRPPGVSGRSS